MRVLHKVHIEMGVPKHPGVSLGPYKEGIMQSPYTHGDLQSPYRESVFQSPFAKCLQIGDFAHRRGLIYTFQSFFTLSSDVAYYIIPVYMCINH